MTLRPICVVGLAALSCAGHGDRRKVGETREVIEPLIAAGERAMKAAAPFDSVAPGAFEAAAAVARAKPKVGNAWVPVGASPLWANSPDYAGSDALANSGPSRLGWA